MALCAEHDYQYMGLQYAHGNNSLPGSGAKRRYYAHVFYCRKCLHHSANTLNEYDNSYNKVRDGAVLGEKKLIVPLDDQSRYY